MKTLLLCATLVLALAPTAISAAKSCASITKGQKCKNAAGCKWDFKTGEAKWKSCSGIVVEDETDAVEDAPDVVIVSGCWKFDKKRKCERKGCDWTKEGKSFKSCNDPAPRPSTIAPADPTAAAAPKAPDSVAWKKLPGCCRADGKQIKVLRKETFSGVNVTEADAVCANQCADDRSCTAYEVTKKKKSKKNKSAQPKFICELHDSEIDSASKRTKSCRAAITTCNIYVSGRPCLEGRLCDFNFKDEIANCLAEDEVGGNCVDTSRFGPMASWDVSDVTDYSKTFKDKASFNGKITGWNTEAATTMEYMFFKAAAFNQPIASWKTGAVTTMEGMFWFAGAFNQPIDSWKTGAVTTFNEMFSNAAAFNQPIASWKTDAVTTMRAMFFNAAAFNQTIASWKTDAVISMQFMFNGATKMVAKDGCGVDGPPSAC